MAGQFKGTSGRSAHQNEHRSSPVSNKDSITSNLEVTSFMPITKMAPLRFTIGLVLHGLVMIPLYFVVVFSNGARGTVTRSGHGGSSEIGSGSPVAHYAGQARRNHSDDEQVRPNNACSAQDCLPYIRMQVTVVLTPEQRLEVQEKQPLVRRWLTANGHQSVRRDIPHGPIVTLTPAQRDQILAQYGDYFSRADELPTLRQSRSVQTQTNICPRQEHWEDLTLALTNDDELIQVVQFPETDDKQWILTERCTQNYCSFVSNCACSTNTRLVRAFVISLDQSVVARKFIKVYCCAAYKTN
ncbi:uncharacterized protein LOC110989883 [Acanthaster planci]|uniref:Uncharacterized protein LOC110989883 n=1 Tax=Acanthaster planci TaxID=133434 RepID=A0A8B7ZZV4_ACAPL|nr:uncharacterized protein LOC110989883 [Acanthaster planci]